MGLFTDGFKLLKKASEPLYVAVYVGNGKVVEALNERVGVVYRDVASVGKIVVIGRP